MVRLARGGFWSLAGEAGSRAFSFASAIGAVRRDPEHTRAAADLRGRASERAGLICGWPAAPPFHRPALVSLVRRLPAADRGAVRGLSRAACWLPPSRRLIARRRAAGKRREAVSRKTIGSRRRRASCRHSGRRIATRIRCGAVDQEYHMARGLAQRSARLR